MVFNSIALELIIIFIFSIISRWLDLFRREMLDCVLVPNDHKAVTVQVSSRHFVLFRPVSLGGEDHNVDEVSELFESSVTLSHAVKESDVAGMTAGVLSDHHWSLNGLPWELRGCAEYLLILILLLALLLAEFLRHLVDSEALSLNPHKDLAFIEQTLIVNDTDKHG